jgi:hypothetical protein
LQKKKKLSTNHHTELMIPDFGAFRKISTSSTLDRVVLQPPPPLYKRPHKTKREHERA